jgi:hypothetical protein
MVVVLLKSLHPVSKGTEEISFITAALLVNYPLIFTFVGWSRLFFIVMMLIAGGVMGLAR